MPGSGHFGPSYEELPLGISGGKAGYQTGGRRGLATEQEEYGGIWMNRTFLWVVGILLLAVGACDHGTQKRLIETYRAADFASSKSHLTRAGVTITSTFDLGRAYQVTSRRMEYVPVPPDSEPPIDAYGQLAGLQVVLAEEPLEDEEQDAAARRAALQYLEVRLPSRVLRRNDLYYRWVVEYTSGNGNRLTMRKSQIFRSRADQMGSESEDEQVTF